MLAGFGENDLDEEAMDRVEAALFERHEDSREQGEIRNLVIHMFGPNRAGRPKIGVTHQRGDETMAIGTDPENKATEALDVITGWIEMLKHEDAVRREMAAKSLVSLAGNTTARGRRSSQPEP